MIEKNMTYEKAVNRLEEIVTLLDKNDVALDDALSLFEEGTALVSFCTKKLSEAKQKITTIEKE